MSVALGLLSDSASTGGKPRPQHQDVDDHPSCSLSPVFSWDEDRSAPSNVQSALPLQAKTALAWCECHAPNEDCDCDVPRPLTSGHDDFKEETPLQPKTPARATRSSSFDNIERPSANPKLSPVHLPPLCGEPSEDSDDDCDDELSTPPAVTVAHDDGLTVPVTQHDGPAGAAAQDHRSTVVWDDEGYLVPGADPLWLFASVAEEQLYLPAPAGTLGSVDLKGKGKERARPSSPLQSLSSNTVVQRATRSTKRLHSERVASESADAETNKITLSAPAFHARVLALSDATEPHSYANALKYVQAAARNLIAENPSVSIDVATPELVPYYRCVFPDCEDCIAPTRTASDRHYREKHWPRDAEGRLVDKKHVLQCPVCPETTQAKSMGRHMFNIHSSKRLSDDDDSALRCKLCSGMFDGTSAYSEHFRQCSKVTQAGPSVVHRRKRQRLD